MFESLNVTGEPLTAFETFIPRVVESVTIDKYKNSDSKKHIDKITNYLYKFSDKDKNKKTSELIIPFALCENGKKLGRSLNEQRIFLRETYTTSKSLQEKELFTKRFSDFPITLILYGNIIQIVILIICFILSILMMINIFHFVIIA